MGHEIEDAFYGAAVLLSDGRPRPTLTCSCGEVCRGASWLEAGAEMDGHLAEVVQ